MPHVENPAVAAGLPVALVSGGHREATAGRSPDQSRLRSDRLKQAAALAAILRPQTRDEALHAHNQHLGAFRRLRRAAPSVPGGGGDALMALAVRHRTNARLMMELAMTLPAERGLA